MSELAEARKALSEAARALGGYTKQRIRADTIGTLESAAIRLRRGDAKLVAYAGEIEDIVRRMAADEAVAKIHVAHDGATTR